MRRIFFLAVCLLSPALLAISSAAGAAEPGPASAPAAKPTGTSVCSAFERQDRRVYDAVAPAVVGITCRDAKGGFFGTGVVVSPDGLVLTSTTTVPAGAHGIRVFFMDAADKEARLIGVDAATESALIKVDGKDLPFVPLADSARARAGDRAYTFGNPFGTLSSDNKVSFSAGHVSGVYRLAENMDFQSKYRDLVIETEAAVNPGSDGGPLVDGQGRLLGIMSLGFSERRWLGAVVPVHLIAPKFEALNDVKPLAEHLKPPAEVSGSEAAWRAAIGRAAPAVVQVLVAREEKPLPRPRATLSYEQQQEELRKRYAVRPPGPASGVIVDPEGLVLTANFHVTGRIRKADEAVRVRLADGRTLPAAILGRDESLDLVMLKVDAGGEKLPAAELSAGPLEVGAQIAVLGRSEDVGSVTVNRGLVSAVGRSLGRTTQISAFVNYGNLGGPAIGPDGRVVGVTGHLVEPQAQWGQNSGVGFITPAAVLREIKADLAAGKVLKPPARTFLGVSPGRDAPELLGAPVGRVLPNSPAAAAGLKAGDVITHLGDSAVEGWSGLVRNIVGHKPGDKVRLTIRRGDKVQDVEVELGKSND